MIRHKFENGFFDVTPFIFPFWGNKEIVAKREMHWVQKRNSGCVCHIISIYDPFHRFENIETICEYELEKSVLEAYKLHLKALKRYLKNGK